MIVFVDSGVLGLLTNPKKEGRPAQHKRRCVLGLGMLGFVPQPNLRGDAIALILSTNPITQMPILLPNIRITIEL
jgi:hypothetical protein